MWVIEPYSQIILALAIIYFMKSQINKHANHAIILARLAVENYLLNAFYALKIHSEHYKVITNVHANQDTMMSIIKSIVQVIDLEIRHIECNY